MATFVDTSGLFAILDAGDQRHHAAAGAWTTFAEQREDLVTSNYVLVEAAALVARRLGFEALRTLQTAIAPVIRVVWVDEPIHSRAVAAVLAAADRRLSLVDCSSFEVMRELGVETAFVFDSDFDERGFHCIP